MTFNFYANLHKLIVYPAGAGARGLGARGGGGGTEGGPYAFIKPSSADVGAHPLPSDRKDEWKDVQVKK